MVNFLVSKGGFGGDERKWRPSICRGLIFVLGSCVIAASCFAQDAQSHSVSSPAVPAGEWKRTVTKLSQTETPPKIDGILDDACWKNATHADGFFRYRSNEPVAEQTEAWICADKTHLYFAFHCLDSKPNLIVANETQRDGNFDQDDALFIVIDSQLARRDCSQFCVNARGTQQTQLEGGTADNLTWAGDWLAATHRTPDGWNCEISIPFSLLKYPKGTHRFAIALARKLARETNVEVWPYVPPAGNNNLTLYMDDFDGISPPFFPPHLVALPYVLATGGQSTNARVGIDLKYPFSTTMTGVATLHPDFETIEQAVNNLSFSYTEKFVPDRRPYFAEGSGFLSDSSLFYSQRIPFVDEGMKLIGKQGPTSIAMLATASQMDGNQDAFVANVSTALGKYSGFGGAVLANRVEGQPGNEVAQVNGDYGWAKGGRRSDIYANATGSWQSNGISDRSDYIQFSSNAGQNKVGGNAWFSEIGPNFVNQLGLVSETDVRGSGFDIYKNIQKDRGPVEYQYFDFSGSSNSHTTGGFFHDSMSAYSSLNLRKGFGFQLGLDAGKRDDFHDNTLTSGFSWNQKKLFQSGGIYMQVGRRENMPYRFVDVSQGVLFSKCFTMQLDVNQALVGGDTTSQVVVSGTYRLRSDQTFGGRLIQQGDSLNAYLSFSRRARHGTDIFLLVGDPNSARTRGIVTLKLVRPF